MLDLLTSVRGNLIGELPFYFAFEKNCMVELY
nr:MAG TPA: hypothetical protein [Caudoviricetes sp.]